ncbi:MAG TPA: PQQ-binding-like beta-propeller repeat protein, partial [Rectinemataceae bacterium]|nr:PQQ-binding-like beta-propeller repeat protein [Rectinemataceae bacterium]
MRAHPVLRPFLALALVCLVSCGQGRTGGGQGSGHGGQQGGAPRAEPREAFSSSGRIAAEALRVDSLVAMTGGGLVPRTAPVSFDAGRLILFAAGKSGDKPAERLLAVDSEGKEGYTIALPAPGLALVAAGGQAIVSCADGSIMGIGFPPGAAGPVELWRRSGAPADRLLALPEERFAEAAEDGSLAILSARSGDELWRTSLQGGASSLSYAPGLVLVGVGSELAAYSEKDGIQAWRAQLGGPAAAASAGAGRAAVIDERGRVSFFDLADGRRLSENPGPFDPDIAPV